MSGFIPGYGCHPSRRESEQKASLTQFWFRFRRVTTTAYVIRWTDFSLRRHSVHLYYLFPCLEEGGLATYRTAIVQNQHLAMLAKVSVTFGHFLTGSMAVGSPRPGGEGRNTVSLRRIAPCLTLYFSHSLGGPSWPRGFGLLIMALKVVVSRRVVAESGGTRCRSSRIAISG